jgi:predicted dehydrogenase
MRPLRIGIIGAGGIAQGAHLPNYKRLGQKVELVAVSDVSKEKAKEAAERFDIPRTYESFEDMLKEEELDAVSVCTPNKFHKPAVIAALKAGCHVLCEKPPAMSVDEAREMADVAQSSEKHLVYGFHYRHTPEVETLKRFINAGELGNVYAARVHAIRRRGIPGWGVFTNKALQGGGPLIDIGVHMLDTALYLMDFPNAVEVVGVTYQNIGKRPGVGLFGSWDWQNYSIEDMARGFIRFDNGASIILETSFAANVEKDEVMNVTLMGDQGGADVFPLKVYQEKHDSLVDLTPVYLPKRSSYEVEIERFVRLCRGEITLDEVPLCTADQGVKVQTILEAMYKSAEIGRAVSL